MSIFICIFLYFIRFSSSIKTIVISILKNLNVHSLSLYFLFFSFSMQTNSWNKFLKKIRNALENTSYCGSKAPRIPLSRTSLNCPAGGQFTRVTIEYVCRAPADNDCKFPLRKRKKSAAFFRSMLIYRAHFGDKAL